MNLTSQTSPPNFDEPFDKACRHLTDHLQAGEDTFAALPAPAERGDEERRTAHRAHQYCRQARRAFLSLHAATVYDMLTDARNNRLRLAELAYQAAAQIPGLTPSHEQITAERRHRQSAKEGREIDQGILVRALLAQPTAGSHLLDSMRYPTPRASRLLPPFRTDGHIRLGTVAIHRSNGATHLTLHNDHCINAEDDTLIEDLETAVDLALLDPDTTVCVLRGGIMTHPRFRGRRIFNAGINLTDLHNGRISYTDFVLRRELAVVSKIQHGLLPRPDDDPDAGGKPWLAVVETFCHGAGLQVLPLFDHVITASDAYFSLRTVEVGVLPGLGSLRLARALGGRLARQMILIGKRFDAHAPEAQQVCDEVVAPDAIECAISTAVEQLARPAVRVNRRFLSLAEEAPETFRAYAAEFAETQARCLYSPELFHFLEQAWIRRRRD
ncbi:enoyl-CoA hydratase/isomerase family protein [Streptomyces sp. NPDC050658]|uniref:enoyl-CoA hydratase/isomerase family protein n=1 Tax=unclassified Streptomyces TaxID=2593676 RepID=UPI003436A268